MTNTAKFKDPTVSWGRSGPVFRPPNGINIFQAWLVPALLSHGSEEEQVGATMAEGKWRSRSFSWQSPLTPPSSSYFSQERTHHHLLRDLGRQPIPAPPWLEALYYGSTDWATQAQRTSPSRPSSLPLSSDLPSGLSPPPLRTPSPVTVSSSVGSASNVCGLLSLMSVCCKSMN